MDFQGLRFEAGFNSRKSVSEYLQVNLSTVSRWEAGEVKPPHAVVELLRMLGGYLPAIGRRDQWHGWRFDKEYLYTPNGDRYTAGDIMAVRTLYARLSNARADVLRLEKQLAAREPAKTNVVQFNDFKKGLKRNEKTN